MVYLYDRVVTQIATAVNIRNQSFCYSFGLTHLQHYTFMLSAPRSKAADLNALKLRASHDNDRMWHCRCLCGPHKLLPRDIILDVTHH